MGRILAIDYGTKRVGIAVTDPLQIIANGLTTVHSKDLIKFLEDYFNKEAVDIVVIGEPKTLSNKQSENEKNIHAFIVNFKKKFPLMKVERYDERFTSGIAQKTMLEGGLRQKARQNKELIDMISAIIILQDYLSFTNR